MLLALVLVELGPVCYLNWQLDPMRCLKRPSRRLLLPIHLISIVTVRLVVMGSSSKPVDRLFFLLMGLVCCRKT